jgi:hypothetical protein
MQGLGRPDEDTRDCGQRYNDEVMGRELAEGMARPGDMLFGRRTWQAFITAWGRTPIVGKIPVQPLADLPVARPFGGQQRDLQFLRGQQVQRPRGTAGRCARRCPEGGGYLAIDGRYWQFMPALACTGIDMASSRAAWCRSRSGWCCSPVRTWARSL